MGSQIDATGEMRRVISPSVAPGEFGDSFGDPTADDIWTLGKTDPRASVAPRFGTCSLQQEVPSARSRTPAGCGAGYTDGRGRPAEVWISKVAWSERACHKRGRLR